MFGLSPLSPAYGRDYASPKAAQADFDNGRDFMTAAGQYVGKLELAAAGFSAAKIECRSADKRRVFMLSTR